jgi:hypothetical protein
MGQEQSIIYEPSYNRLDYSKELKISAWDTYPSKNAEYYSGERFFKVSRKHYPQYTRGYIWGYWEDDNYYKPLEEEEIERAF